MKSTFPCRHSLTKYNLERLYNFLLMGDTTDVNAQKTMECLLRRPRPRLAHSLGFRPNRLPPGTPGRMNAAALILQLSNLRTPADRPQV
ncbi:hypothetical protein VTK26DRAFT_1528 [Humicola hyalothermophila]